MPSKWKKDKPMLCKWCNKKIVLHTDLTQTWIHVDTGETKGTFPMIHNAMPYNRAEQTPAAEK